MNLTESKIGSYSYSCLMAALRPEDAFSIVSSLTSKVSSSDIHWGDGNGAELEPHVTVLYGLHETRPDPFIALLGERQKFTVRIAGLSTFDGDEYDVLKLDVESPELTHLNSELRRKFKYTSKFSSYSPHITIAYLKKGVSQRYLWLPIPLQRAVVSGYWFSSSDDAIGKVSIPCIESLARTLLNGPGGKG